MLNLDSAPVYTDFDGLAKLKLDAHEQSPDALKKVASQFESIFVNMMLKSMRQAKLADGITDSQQSEFYLDMYDHQIATQLASNPGIGIADFIVKQLSPKKPAADARKELDEYRSDSADSSGTSGEATAASSNPAAYISSANPLDASGLSSLAGFESLRRSRNDTWQSQEDEWKSMKTGGNQPISSKEDFINQLLPHARQAASALGVDANLLLAQAALETGWGQGVIKNNQGESSFNLFNIKADKSWQGKQTKTLTLEFDSGVARNGHTIKQLTGDFRLSNPLPRLRLQKQSCHILSFLKIVIE